MHALYDTTSSSNTDSMITSWITTHGKSSLTKLDNLVVNDNKLVFNDENESERFEVVIDEKLPIQDKLSQVFLICRLFYDFYMNKWERNKFKLLFLYYFQVNVLQQLHNIGSYSFVKEQLRNKQLYLHALWFDIANGEMHMFSKESASFQLVNEDTIKSIFKSV